MASQTLWILFVVMVTMCRGEKVQYKDCGSTGMVKSVMISPCPKQPCVLKYNSNINLKMEFLTRHDTKDLTAIMTGIIAGTPIPQPLPDPDACDSGVKCPIKNGDQNVFSQSIYIEYDFPTGNITAQIELKDDSGNDVTCVQIPVTISS